MTKWNQILREKEYSPEEPEENVVKFVKSLEKRKLRILDLGCGAGRHVIFMARQGFEVHGADISDTGLSLTKDRLKQQGLEGCLIKCDMKMLPYTDSCFNVIVCIHAIYHQKREEIRRTISEIYRILRKNGKLLVNFLSKRTYSYGSGLKVGDDTFVEQEGVEKGVLHYFTNKEDIECFFEDFEIVNIELYEKDVEGKLRSRFIVTATK